MEFHSAPPELRSYMEQAEEKEQLREHIEAYLDRGEDRPLRCLLENVSPEIIRAVLVELQPYEISAVLKMILPNGAANEPLDNALQKLIHARRNALPVMNVSNRFIGIIDRQTPSQVPERTLRQRPAFLCEETMQVPLRRVGFWFSLFVFVFTGWMPHGIFRALPEALMVLVIWLPLLASYHSGLKAMPIFAALLSQLLALAFVWWRLDFHIAACIAFATTCTFCLAIITHAFVRFACRSRYGARVYSLPLLSRVCFDAALLYIFIGIVRVLLHGSV